jgi:hypothetical protein
MDDWLPPSAVIVSGDWSRLFSRIGANNLCKKGVEVAEGGGMSMGNPAVGTDAMDIDEARGFSMLVVAVIPVAADDSCCFSSSHAAASKPSSMSSSIIADEPGAKLSLLFALDNATNKEAREEASAPAPREPLVEDAGATLKNLKKSLKFI